MKQRILKIVKSVLGTVEYSLRPWKYSSDELIVLCMHSTPMDRRDQFNKLLDFVLKHFQPLDPKQLADYFDGKMNAGPYVLFTFDDGLKNNVLAAELLEARNVRAVFFVVPDFVDAIEPENYYRKNIRQAIDRSVDHEPDDFTPLTRHELAQLAAKGHCIESHTMSHLLRKHSDEASIEREIRQSKLWIGQNLPGQSSMFCSPIQTNFSISSSAKKVINQVYDYHFTTFPGLNCLEKDSKLIYRRNIEVHWTFGQIKYALGKVDLSRWKGEIAQFRQL